ncbi:unnamed protein product [Durusdinium trenchii]|uniref:NADP-dependent oxidoreductase domain-containing protein n=1 Tax=Durusdinium trenchii TaxID=1381693 RepID=A0ABP0LXS8_9DINO
MSLPEVFFGTMTFGWSQASSKVDDAVAYEMLKKFVDLGGVQVDTARIYSAGETENILGRILPKLRGESSAAEKDLILGTKVHPSQPNGLSEIGIRKQLEASLKAMNVSRVEILYLHQPDPEHDLLESLQCVQQLIKEGLVGRYGMSNYSAIEVDRCCTLCKDRGWSMPSVYQGLYNPLNRLAEAELLPVLRKFGVSFVAYNPLAAGLLTGKHLATDDVLPGRFKDNPNYLPRFYTKPNFDALSGIRSACEEAKISMVDATYSWLLQHSTLSAAKGDGILLGASSTSQLEQNLSACKNPVSLPPPVLAAFDAAWPVVQAGGDVFPYWRSYSKDQPGRESLPPGASYSAAKK